MPRGQGKSTLVAALGLYDLMLGEEGSTVVVAATDERQAGIVFRTAVRMVVPHDDLASRVQMYKTELRVPGRGASFQCLPAEPKRLEGLDYTLAILDEIGVIGRDSYEVVHLAQGKRGFSTLIGIGTPGPDPHNNVLADLRTYAFDNPDDRRWYGGSSAQPASRTTRWTVRTAGRWPTRRWTTSCTGMPCTRAAAEDEGSHVSPSKVVSVHPRHGRQVSTARCMGWPGDRPADPGRRLGGRRARRLVLRRHHGAAGRDGIGDTALRHHQGVAAARG